MVIEYFAELMIATMGPANKALIIIGKAAWSVATVVNWLVLPLVLLRFIVGRGAGGLRACLRTVCFSYLVLAFAAMVEPRVFASSGSIGNPPSRAESMAFLAGFLLLAVCSLGGAFLVSSKEESVISRTAAAVCIVLAFSLGVVIDFMVVVGIGRIGTSVLPLAFLTSGKAIFLAGAIIDLRLYVRPRPTPS